MSRRILTAILTVTVLAVVLFGLPLGIALRRLYRNEAVVRLEREAARASIAVPASFEQTRDPVELSVRRDGTLLAVYDRQGRKLKGVGPAHADREVARALTGQLSDGAHGGQLVVALPVTSEERVFAVLRAAVPEGAVNSRIRRGWLAMGLLAVAVIGLAALVARWHARRLGRPVLALASAAAQLGDGDFSVRADAVGVPEVDAAASALNATAERLGELVGRERTFSADASHQLRTPLTGLRLQLESTLLDPKANRDAAIERALGDIDRLEATVEDLLALARDASPARDPVRVDGLLADADLRWHGPLAAAGRPLRIDVDATLPLVRASAAAIGQVLDVLIGNAQQHGRGAVTVRARRAPRSLAIEVSDEGPGPPIDGHDVFRRRPESATGRGIGLALARSLTEAEGGRLTLSRTGPSPRFTLLLPAAET
jgi:signal transduction histidine kinase